MYKETPDMAQKLFVGSLSFSTTTDGLRELFAKCGTVLSATVVTDQFSGRSRGFGFVEMATAEEAQRAVAQLDRRSVDGRPIKVELAKPKAATESRGYSGRGGRGGWR
jgi:RNA recognition motif-containing protein